MNYTSTCAFLVVFTRNVCFSELITLADINIMVKYTIPSQNKFISLNGKVVRKQLKVNTSEHIHRADDYFINTSGGPIPKHFPAPISTFHLPYFPIVTFMLRTLFPAVL